MQSLAESAAEEVNSRDLSFLLGRALEEKRREEAAQREEVRKKVEAEAEATKQQE